MMKILMVCTGNICRSPLAEGILKSKLPGATVDSAGTISLHEGEHPDKRAVAVAAEHQIDISDLRARTITKEDLSHFDKIFCMDLGNLEDVVSMTSGEKQREKVSLILDAAGIPEKVEVPDPYYDGEKEFAEVYDLLDTACTKIAQQYKPKS